MNKILESYYAATEPIGEAIIQWARPAGWAVSPTTVIFELFY
jgi:hypothetical protein